MHGRVWVRTTWASRPKRDNVAHPGGEVEYTVSDSDGRSVAFEADNWMTAAAACLVELGADINAFGTLVCTMRADGSVVMKEELSGLRWTVREKVPEPQIQVVISPRSQQLQPAEELDNDFRNVEEDEPSQIYNDPPPALTVPTTSLARERGDTLAERLFDLSMDFVVAEPEEAVSMCLQLLNEYVPCETTIAVLGSYDEPLKVVDARGTSAREVIGREIPLGEGLIGTCFDMRETIRVHDVFASIPYSARYDGVNGFAVGCVLAVPIVDEETMVYGVIELLNPAGRAFLDADVDAAETVARTLGQALANR